MSVDFGEVRNYLSERGFGFVRGLLVGNQSEVFFHIKTVKKADPTLAAKLADDPLAEDFHFWFDTEITQKGTQVRSVLTAEQVRRGAAADISLLISKVEFHWSDISSPKANWLDRVTIDLLGITRLEEMKQERNRLEEEERSFREQHRKTLDAQRAIEEEERQLQLDAIKLQEAIKEDEFKMLVAEMRELGFTLSNQVSAYIVRNRLGYKYRNISGVLQMENHGTVWDFKGGFSPKIYARLCDALGLSNNGSGARPVAFKSFNSVAEGRQDE